jgi:hypothetical protein
VFFVSQAGISLRSKFNRIVTVDNQRNRGAKIAGVQVFGSEAGSVRHIRPKRVIFHLTEDRAPTSPSRHLFLDFHTTSAALSHGGHRLRSRTEDAASPSTSPPHLWASTVGAATV